MKDNLYIPLIFKIICIILLVSCLVGVLVNPSFEFQGTTTLLNTISNAPILDANFLLTAIPTILDDWGLFNWFRDLLNLLVNALNLVVFFGGNLVNLLIYISYFFKYVFNFA